MAKLQDRARDRASDVKPYLERALKDERVREDVKSAIATARDLRDAADRVQGKSSHSGRNATLLLTGIALGILFNPVTGPGTRRWLQDKVFGEGEEFEYRQNNAK